MSTAWCANRHAHDFGEFGRACPDCGAALRFRTRYTAPDRLTKARMVGCELMLADVPEARSIVVFYEATLRDGFARKRLARTLATKLTREHPVWRDDAATDAAFAVTLCRDEIDRDAMLQAARRRALREKNRATHGAAASATHLSGV